MFKLPRPREGEEWSREIDTTDARGGRPGLHREGTLLLKARSVVVLRMVPGEEPAAEA
jgi:hypothetical protein